MAVITGTLGNAAKNLLHLKLAGMLLCLKFSGSRLRGKFQCYIQGRKPPIKGMDLAFNQIGCHGILSVIDNFAIISSFSAATTESPPDCPQDASFGQGCNIAAAMATSITVSILSCLG